LGYAAILYRVPPLSACYFGVGRFLNIYARRPTRTEIET